MKFELEVRNKETDSVLTKRFEQGTLKIGNLTSSHLRLMDGSVSKMHCMIDSEDGEISVMDLGTTVGIRVNGKRVNKSQLNLGDILGVGNYEITLAAIGHDGSTMKNIRERLEVDASATNEKTKGWSDFPKGAFSVPDASQVVNEMHSEINTGVETFNVLCELAEEAAGKFDMPRMAKAVDVLISEAGPVGALIKDHLGQIDEWHSNRCTQICLKQAQLVSDMKGKGITEDAAMVILDKTWSSFSNGMKDVVKSVETAKQEREKK